MYYYILEQYKNEIYNKNNFKSFKELTLEEKVMLILLIGTSVGFLVLIFMKHIILAAISILILVADIIAMMKYSDKHWKKTNMESMQKYKERKIDELIKLLKKPEVMLYGEKEINWLLNMCESAINDNKNGSSFLNPIKTFFSMLIYPIIGAVAAIVVKDMNSNDIVKIAALTIGLLVEIFVIFYMLYPMVDDYLNRNKKLIKAFKEDLQYILIKYQ